MVATRPTHRCSNENMDDGSEWTAKGRKTKTEVERCGTKRHDEGSASLEDWHKLARTGETVWLYNGRDRKKTGKIVRNGHFGRAVSESLLGT